MIAEIPPAFAAPAPPPDDGIVVTGSRTAFGPSPEVTILDAASIERRQPLSLLEVLNEAAGVRAFSTGGIGGGSFVSIEGGEPNFTLVLLDGLKLNNPTNSRGGAFDFTQIDPSLVRSIEVARGPLSAVYGSDALAGVINIRLREPPPDGMRFAGRVSGDTRGATDGALSFGGGWGSGGALFSTGHFGSGDEDPGSTLRRDQALARVRQRLGGFDLRLLGLFADTERSAFPEDSGGPLLAVSRKRETGRGHLRAAGLSFARAPGSGLRPELSVSWSEQRERTATPAIRKGVLDAVPALTARDRFSRFETVGTLGYARGLISAAAGASLLREDGSSRGTIDFGFPLPVTFAKVRTTSSGFAEATVTPLPAVTLNLAGRYDSVHRGPGTWTGRAGISLRTAAAAAAAGPVLFARIGNGYKLPSFYALGHPLIGNPSLKAERSRHAEAGADWNGSGWSLRLAAFENRFRDLIDFDPAIFKTVNRDRVRARGFEAEGRATLTPALAMTAALTRLWLKSPTPLRGRPDWQGSASLAWTPAERIELTGHLRFNSDYFDSSIPTGPIRTGSRIEADIGAAWRLSSILSLRASLRNLGDERQGDAVGFPAPGRSLRVTLTASSF